MTGLYLGALHFDGDPDALLIAGLPTPRVEPLGDVHVAHLLNEVGR
jgi:hypothetical protein